VHVVCAEHVTGLNEMRIMAVDVCFAQESVQAAGKLWQNVQLNALAPAVA
jgi:hypothetical protein